jgi:PAS domain S-box-containing protein
MEYRLLHHDGVYRWVLAHGMPRSQGGEFAGFIGSCIDITDRKQAEAAVRSSELQIRLVTDTASVYLCQIDRSGYFKFVNRAYAARYGRKTHEMIGMHLSEVIGEEAFRLTKPHIDYALQGNREEYEIELPYPTLGLRWVHMVYVPERSLDGQVVGLVAVLTDTTERRLAEKELERARDEAVAASRAKDDFLAALSHELRTPLSPVLLLASDAAENLDLPAAARADFETIRKNVELEARLIDDLLDLTRITRGKLTLELATVDVHTIVRDAVATVQADLDAKQIELSLQLNAGSARVLGDPVRLQQVFWNVLKNAVKFTPEHGKITVVSEELKQHEALRVQISDTGIGLTAPELERVFEAFAQGDHAGGGGSHRFGGLGLGLAISRKVVELHAGHILVASEGRNQGAVFTIELPLLSPGGETPRPAAEPPSLSQSAPPFGNGHSRGSILLVEDHAPTRNTLELLLQRRGYHVVTVGSVAEGRAAAEKEKIHLVISDIGLPDGNGFELMTELKQRYQLRGIALTGYGMESDVSRSLAAGFVVHLTKPVRVQSLNEALEIAGAAALAR